MEHQFSPTAAEVNAPEWLTVAEFAEATRISIPTVYRHAARGQIRAARRGGCIRIPREELRAFREEAVGKMAS